MRNILVALSMLIVAASCGQTNAGKEAVNSYPINPSDFKFKPLSHREAEAYGMAAKDFYEKNLASKGFNGSILVAKNGEIVFEDYRGYSNFQTKEPITEHTPFHLASISKTFTGMAILKLWEEGEISLDDTLQDFFPELPYKGITIKMLLSHRSGLPNYLNFMDHLNGKGKITNEDVLNFMIKNKPAIEALPNKFFHYCNTNFMLLALVIENVTGQSYPEYMEDSLFTPLGMQDTYVFTVEDTASYVPTYSATRPFPMDNFDCTYGDKNIYSTVRDILLWDRALYEHTFLKQSTLEMAFTPQSSERRSMHNYGLAWRLYFHNGDTVIYHNGKWHGSNTVFTRLVQNTATIIVLGNKYNRNIYSAKEMSSIFTGRSDTTSLVE